MKNSIVFEKINIASIGDVNEAINLKYMFLGDVFQIKNANNEIVGFLDLKYSNQYEHYYIELLEILPQFRRKGYGAMVANKLIELYSSYRILGQAEDIESKLFWESVGATFGSCEETDCDYDSYKTCPRVNHCDHPADLFFSLT